jgi:hypothetical protein
MTTLFRADNGAVHALASDAMLHPWLGSGLPSTRCTRCAITGTGCALSSVVEVLSDRLNCTAACDSRPCSRPIRSSNVLTLEHHALSDLSGALSDDGILILRVGLVQIRVGVDGLIASIGSPTESSPLRLASAVMSELVLRVGREVGLVHVVENKPNHLTTGLRQLVIDADPSLPCIICTMRLDDEHGIGRVGACSNEVVVKDAEHVRRDGSRARLRRICRQGRADRISAQVNKLARVIADARKQIGQLIRSTRSTRPYLVGEGTLYVSGRHRNACMDYEL